MNIRVRSLTYDEDKIWDEFVKASPQGEAFHRSSILKAWPRHDGEIHLLRLGCFDEQNTLVGAQAFLHKKRFKFFYTQALLTTWTNIETPMLANHVVPKSDLYFSILQSLADYTKKWFIYYYIFCHSSLNDLRPYLMSGWSARPDYTHTWDLHNINDLLEFLKSKRRFANVEKTLKRFSFTHETKPSVIQEFSQFYKNYAVKKRFPLRDSFSKIFEESAKELFNRNQLRMHSCRRNNGELIAMATYVINPLKKNAIGWYLARIEFSNAEKDVIPALYFYSIELLSNEVTLIDIGESGHVSLDLFKDSLGTQSKVYYILETPNVKFWGKVFNTLRYLKRKFSKPENSL